MKIRSTIANWLNLRHANLMIPLTALAMMGGAIIAGGIAYGVTTFDDISLDREQKIVSNGIAQRIKEVSLLIVPQVVWDDAVTYLDNRFDANWAAQNLGTFLHDVNGFEFIFVVDGADRATYASRDGDNVQLDVIKAFRPGFAPLIRDVRIRERKRPPLVPAPSAHTMISSPIQSSAIAVVHGSPQILTATLVQPDFGTAMPSGSRAPIVLTAMPMDQAFLENLARRYLLRDAHVHVGRQPAEGGRAIVPLRDLDGATIANFDWVAHTPGTDLLKRLIAPLFVLLTTITVVALLLIRRSSRYANELIASEARATHLAYHDSLTGLPNRVLMFDKLGQIRGRMRDYNGQVAVHCIDLDRFKFVNDTLGHHAGDELIIQATRRIKDVCRGADVVARLGGDEFVILQPNADVTVASQLARAVIEAISQPFILAEGSAFVGCSVGVTIVSSTDIEPVEILRQADLAMYNAKNGGRGRFAFFETEMDAALNVRRGLECDLRQALRDDELRMVYQPQVDRHGRITGLEALVRWEHRDRGSIAPSVFVPLAEECGLINELSLCTIRRIFEESRNWPTLRTAINISTTQLRSPSFSNALERLGREFGIDPAMFELEITEAALIDSDVVTRKTLHRIRRLGYSIALDDFGTGCSSLSYLQNYPVDKIKIDGSFVANLGIGDKSEAVIEAIVRLARAIKVDVIAEAVETDDQRMRLIAAGCSTVQGFLISEPVPADQVLVLVNDLHARVSAIAS